MTTSEVKTILINALKSKKKYILTKDTRAEYEQTLFGRGISYESDGSTRQKGVNKTQEAYDLLAEYEENEKRAETEWILATSLANKYIASLRDDKQREVLTRHYINGKDWAIVAEEMHYSESRIYQLHGYALKNITLNYSNDM